MLALTGLHLDLSVISTVAWILLPCFILWQSHWPVSCVLPSLHRILHCPQCPVSSCRSKAAGVCVLVTCIATMLCGSFFWDATTYFAGAERRYGKTTATHTPHTNVRSTLCVCMHTHTHSGLTMARSVGLMACSFLGGSLGGLATATIYPHAAEFGPRIYSAAQMGNGTDTARGE